VLSESRDNVLVEAITVGALGMLVVTAGLTALGTALVGKKLMRVVRLRETLIRAAIGLGVGLFGWLAAWLHLHIFDPMFLEEGSIENFNREVPPVRDKTVTAQAAGEAVLPEQRKAEAALPQAEGVVAPESLPVGVDAVEALPRAAAPAAEPFGGNGSANEARVVTDQFPGHLKIEKGRGSDTD
jgi:hypothetical protein